MGKAELSQAGQKMEGKDDDTPPPLIHAVWIMRDKVSSQFVNSDKPTNEWILKNVLDSLYIVPFCLSHIYQNECVHPLMKQYSGGREPQDEGREANR